MSNTMDGQVANGSPRSRLFYFNGGFFTQNTVRRIVELAGFDLQLGKPGTDDLVAVWGKSPTSGRGEAVSDFTGAGLVHIEDAFLRSIKPGRSGAPPLGLTIDRQRPYFDSSGPSDLEELLASHPLDDSAMMAGARAQIARITSLHLSKYNDFPLDTPLPEPGYVLVIDQTRDDASITYGGGSVAAFREMLVFAQQDHPGARIVIKTHPDTMEGHREGHFGPEHLTDPRISLISDPVSPYALMDGAIAVYTVTSTMGFEAILAGHKPVVFGQPFYAGWGLTQDHQPIDRRQRNLTRAQLFAGAMILYPKWYDPYRDALCDLSGVIDTLEAQTRAHRQDHQGHVALGMSAWKRPHLGQFFGDVVYSDGPDAPDSMLIWASKMPDILPPKAQILRVEDGFLRSRGLGAELVPPLSLVTDAAGIYYDATAPSDLEHLIAASVELAPDRLKRAADLRRVLTSKGLSKYNLAGERPEIDASGREVILVVGQVEDDASIKFGADKIATNAALLAATRSDFPDAYLIYKPHPDVEAGLRSGAIEATQADMITSKADPIALLSEVDRVATMTSLLGFEAMIRDIPVTCYGAPFYAGWGLTDDRGAELPRRRARPSLEALIHAALIDYPRYFDPVTALACPVEVAVARLADPSLPSKPVKLRAAARLQKLFAGLLPALRK
jgi:capsular polysaccharide export protein